MIVSAVADPTAFGPAGITDELSKREAIAFLKGIVSNGVLLDEPTLELIRSAIFEVTKLPTKMGQKIQLLLTEIKKQHKKFIVVCDQTRWQQVNASTISDKCAALAKCLVADVVVTHESNHSEIREKCGKITEVCYLSDASESNFEFTRNRLAQFDKPLDRLPLPEIEEYLGRALKYASVVRFYDFRMIGSPKRVTKYLSGIQFFVSIWEKVCVVGDRSSRRIELFTLGNTNSLNGFISGSDADELLKTGIQVPLQAVTEANVARFVKEDKMPPIFHTRGFEARSRAYTIDPGFDAIDAGGTVRRCLLKADVAAESHFADCRKLKDLSDT